MPSRGPSPQRLLAAAVYLPIGLGAKAVEELPDAVDRVRRELTVARFFGKMVVDRSVAEFRERLTDPAVRPAPRSGPTAMTHPVPVTGDGRTGDDPSDENIASSSTTTEPPDATQVAGLSADALALPDYDQLPAAHILGKLDGLTPDERDAIRRYEIAHRHRRTVIGKLEQLSAASAS